MHGENISWEVTTTKYTVYKKRISEHHLHVFFVKFLLNIPYACMRVYFKKTWEATTAKYKVMYSFLKQIKNTLSKCI